MSFVRVRFPPSPTGFCHVGTARMALLNYLFAKRQGGSIIFRSEDTDRARSTREFEDDIVEQLHWLGLNWDEFYRDSELLSEHQKAITTLLGSGKAYVSKEKSKQDESLEVEVVRLKNAGKDVTFTDAVRGEITFNTTELGDFVIARAIDDPLYHLAVVVDDAMQHITHVIRGEEHISNTPRQILIQEALGYDRPRYAHYPLFLSPDRAKLSKRKGDVAIKEYRANGFLPAALLNFIGTLGWTPPSNREVMSLSEMIEEFDLNDLHKSGAVFDMEKLRWYNRTYLEQMDVAAFSTYALPTLQEALSARGIQASGLEKLVPLLKERVSVSSDIRELAAAGEFDYFFKKPVLDVATIPGRGSTAYEARTHLLKLNDLFSGITFESADIVKNAVWEYASDHGRAQVLWPLRYALSGKEKSPDPFMISFMIGKEETLVRIGEAARLLS